MEYVILAQVVHRAFGGRRLSSTTGGPRCVRSSTTLRLRMDRFLRRVASHPLASSSSSSQSSVPQPAPSESWDDDDIPCDFSDTASEASVSSIEEAFEDQNEEYTRMLLDLEKEDPSACAWVRQSNDAQTPHAEFLHRRATKILLVIASLQTPSLLNADPGPNLVAQGL